MEFFGLIELLEAYFEDKGYYFIAGDDAYANAVADENVYENNELIVIVSVPSTIPDLLNSRVTSTNYNLIIAIGRKRELEDEEETESSLDETFEQKYSRRLKDLGQIWVKDIAGFACANNLELSNINMKMDINKLDMNADFVAGTLNIIVE